MMSSARLVRRSFVALMLAALPACGAEQRNDTSVLDETSAPLVVAPCTGAAISAAVAAGGDVTLDCGPSPVTITVPPTTVSLSTRLHALVPGSVTLTHGGTLFTVNGPGVTFEVDHVNFVGSSSSFMAVHLTGATAATIVGSSFTGYQGFALSAHSGAVLSVSASTFSNNGGPSSHFGTAIYNEGGQTTVADSTFTGNRSSGSGGAITSFGGTLSITGCTFVGNTGAVGGALYASTGGAPRIVNSTFVNNRGTSAGGAIHASAVGTLVSVANSTFANNFSPLGTFTGGVSLSNSILIDFFSPAGAPCSVSGAGNIAWPPSSSSCGPGFRFGDPRLGSLASNGGPTQTLALAPGSAAIDSAIGSLCPPDDQRHAARPRDGDGNGSFGCDVGAFER